MLLSFLSSCISECPKGYAAHYTAHGALCPSSSPLYPAIEMILATASLTSPDATVEYSLCIASVA